MRKIQPFPSQIKISYKKQGKKEVAGLAEHNMAKTNSMANIYH